MKSLLFLLALAAGAAEPARHRDTAGTSLGEVLAAAREKYPDANLISITGRTDATGSAICDTRSPASDGWHYHFHSPSTDAFVLIAKCRGYIVGPMKELMAVSRDAPRSPITGKFFDNDEVLSELKKAKVSLDPLAHGGGGKRPFSFTLLRVEDSRFKDNPVFWQVKIGNGVWMVNAATHRIEKDVLVRFERVGDSPSVGSNVPGAGPNLGASGSSGGGLGIPKRAKKAKGYTAKADLEKVKAYARKAYPGAVLMAIDGIADAWGVAECAGPGDGWAYYYYWPRSRAIETVYACNGEVHGGQGAYIPVNLTNHKELPSETPFIDSDQAMDGLLGSKESVMNEGMGRFYTRKVPMRLFQYRNSPFTKPELWKTTFLWEAEIGSAVHSIDAKTGKYVAEKGR